VVHAATVNPERRGTKAALHYAATDDIARRLVSIFLPGPQDRRPVHGWDDLLATDPRWKDSIPFHEDFHGTPGWAWAPNTRPGGRRSSPS
jgi:hypothetical protein